MIFLFLFLSFGTFKLEAARKASLSNEDLTVLPSQSLEDTVVEDEVNVLSADERDCAYDLDQSKKSHEDQFLVRGLHASSAENISVPATHKKSGESGSRAFRNVTTDENSSNHLTLCSSSSDGKAGRTWRQWWESCPLGEKIDLSLVGALFAFAWELMPFVLS